MIEPEWSDEVKRLHDGISLHLLADLEQATNSWVAVRLDTGAVSTDLYDSRAKAIAHQAKDWEFFYIHIEPTGLSYREAEAILRVNRGMAKMGMRIGGEREGVLPIEQRDIGPPKLTTPNLPRLTKLLYVMAHHIDELPAGPERQWWQNEYKRIRGIIHGT